MTNNRRPSWWRGMDNEDEMDEADWRERAGSQARSMLNALSWQDSCPDEDGTPTGGCYNGDYTEAEHEEANRKLDEDEYYEAEQTESANTLWGWFTGRN